MMSRWIGLFAAMFIGLFVADPAHAQEISQQEIDKQYKQALDLQKQGRYREAAAVGEKILPAAESVHGKDSTKIATILHNIGRSYTGMGLYAKAEPLYLRSLHIREAKLGKDHTNVASSVNSLAIVYEKMGQYAKAEPLYLRSLQIDEAKRGKDDPSVATCLNNLALLYKVMGQYAKAEPLYVRSLQIREAKLGKDHLELATPLNNLAGLYRSMGQYAKAEPLYLRGLQIREAKLGKDHPDVANSLNSLAVFYRGLGQNAKAAPLYLRSLKIREAKLGKDHPDVANSLNNLASVYRSMRQYAKAESLYLRSLEIREAKLGKDHPDVATSLNSLAVFYRVRGQYAKAEPLYLRSLQIREAKLGKDHPSMATSLNNLAVLYDYMGQYAKAEDLYQRCLQIREAKLGKDHPDLALSLNNLAWNLASQKDWPRAVATVQKARQGLANHLATILPALTESEQLILLETHFKSSFHRALSLGWNAPAEAGPASAEWLLNGKAIAHQSLAEQQLLARDAKDPRNKALVESLQQARGQLSALAYRSPEPGQEKQYQQKMKELKARESLLAKRLALAVGRDHRANSWVTLDDLRARLAPETAFIEIARFSLWDFSANKSKGPRYIAWITPPRGKGEVQLIDLGEAEPIDQLVDQTRKTLLESAKSVTKVGAIEADAVLQKPLMQLSAKVLHPLLPAIEKYAEWVVCPDGALWLTPWTALMLPDGKFTVEKHLVRHVVSGRDLVLELPKTKAESAYIFADPDYDLSPAKARTASAPRGDERELRFAGSAHSKLPQVPRLPGTAVEAEAIGIKLQQWLGQEPKFFLEEKASKARLKSLKRPRILTLATHGYFLPAQDVDQKESQSREIGEEKRTAKLRDTKGQPIENPLLRCGLLLAGCNKRAEAKTGDDDGILMGLEIVGMDLQGCELVVLSACETGLGDIRSGEGVAGLRQAFQLAGAKAVLASLWQVPDRDTAFLMNTFYGELAKGRSQAAALREAQLQRIAARRSQFGAAHPFYWAAFSLTNRGD